MNLTRMARRAAEWVQPAPLQSAGSICGVETGQNSPAQRNDINLYLWSASSKSTDFGRFPD